MNHSYLQAFLEYYWLRPETAMWRALDCTALARFKFRRPSLDLGCGDGAFSFIRAGAVYEPDYDAFLHVGGLDRFFEGEDIYNRFDAAAAKLSIAKPPSYRFDVGLDHKPALISKAGLTGLYLNFVEADANMPLPLPSGHFATVFANIVYWLSNHQATLAEIARVLKPDGRAYLHLPSDTFRNYSFYQRLYVQTGNTKWQWLERIDRGRSDSIKLVQSIEQWQADFEVAGLRIVSSQRYLSKLTLETWDIGLRPLSPVLIELVRKLTAEERLDVKSKWIAALQPLLENLCAIDFDADVDHAPGFFFV
jgi:SAM-dependent methyltransferase